MKKRVFLSLGFRNRTEEEIISDIEQAKNIIISEYPYDEFEFIHNYYYEGDNRVECLGEAIKKMSTCHIAAFISGWPNYRGCKAELEICRSYNIPHIEVSLDFKRALYFR